MYERQPKGHDIDKTFSPGGFMDSSCSTQKNTAAPTSKETLSELIGRIHAGIKTRYENGNTKANLCKTEIAGEFFRLGILLEEHASSYDHFEQLYNAHILNGFIGCKNLKSLPLQGAISSLECKAAAGYDSKIDVSSLYQFASDHGLSLGKVEPDHCFGLPCIRL